ncbi:MAG: hypothetical protein OER92_09545, partial [Alphaproteobacteria bacterium]|nr:hypothetical protein [Alphaproteobacteria bacterium]
MPVINSPGRSVIEFALRSRHVQALARNAKQLQIFARDVNRVQETGQDALPGQRGDWEYFTLAAQNRGICLLSQGLLINF